MPDRHFVAFKGQKQGDIKGNCAKTGRTAKWTEVLSFAMAAETPVDSSGGTPSGARHHRLLSITKEFGPATPQLLEALRANEAIETIIIETVAAGALNSLRITRRVTLTNAAIDNLSSRVGLNGGKKVFLNDFKIRFENIQQDVF
jgi:type VI secretion system Hcp family effector